MPLNEYPVPAGGDLATGELGGVLISAFDTLTGDETSGDLESAIMHDVIAAWVESVFFTD